MIDCVSNILSHALTKVSYSRLFRSLYRDDMIILMSLSRFATTFSRVSSTRFSVSAIICRDVDIGKSGKRRATTIVVLADMRRFSCYAPLKLKSQLLVYICHHSLKSCNYWLCLRATVYLLRLSYLLFHYSHFSLRSRFVYCVKRYLLYSLTVLIHHVSFE